MRYAVISKEKNDRMHTIIRFLDISETINSIVDLSMLPAFADEQIDFSWEQVINIEGLELDGNELYNDETQTFEKAPEPRNSQLTKLQLMQRLTPHEQVLLFFPDDAEGVPANARIPLKLFAKQIELANFIDVDRPDTVAALQQLEDLGLLSHGRVNEIRGVTE